MKVVEYFGRVGVQATGYVYHTRPDNIGDPLEASGDREIVFEDCASYAPHVNQPGVYVVFGPCPMCNKFFSDYRSHIRMELEDDFFQGMNSAAAAVRRDEGANFLVDLMEDLRNEEVDENNNEII